MLDLYLAPHVGALYSSIRSRALIQYFAPYASADMAKMATSFNTSVNALENELIGLILGGQIEGRIDSQNKVTSLTLTYDLNVTFFNFNLGAGAIC